MAEDVKEETEKNELPEFSFNREKDDYIYFDSIKSAMIDAVESISAQINRTSNNNNLLETGYPELDFDNGELIVLSSRPRIGKTAFALSLIKKLAIDKNIPIGVINPGAIDNTKLGKRLLSIICEIPLCRMIYGWLNRTDFQKIKENGRKLYDAPIFTITEPNMNFSYFSHNARKMLKQKPIKLLIVEGFEYFAEVVDSNRDEYRCMVGFLMDRFKEFAVKNNIPIILIMGLSESENEDEPHLKEFRKNLVVPYKADMVIMIHRDENDEAKYRVVKNVNGGCYEVRLKYDHHIGLFEKAKEDD